MVDPMCGKITGLGIWGSPALTRVLGVIWSSEGALMNLLVNNWVTTIFLHVPCSQLQLLLRPAAISSRIKTPQCTVILFSLTSNGENTYPNLPSLNQPNSSFHPFCSTFPYPLLASLPSKSCFLISYFLLPLFLLFLFHFAYIIFIHLIDCYALIIFFFPMILFFLIVVIDFYFIFFSLSFSFCSHKEDEIQSQNNLKPVTTYMASTKLSALEIASLFFFFFYPYMRYDIVLFSHIEYIQFDAHPTARKSYQIKIFNLRPDKNKNQNRSLTRKPESLTAHSPINQFFFSFLSHLTHLLLTFFFPFFSPLFSHTLGHSLKNLQCFSKYYHLTKILLLISSRGGLCITAYLQSSLTRVELFESPCRKLLSSDHPACIKKNGTNFPSQITKLTLKEFKPNSLIEGIIHQGAIHGTSLPSAIAYMLPEVWFKKFSIHVICIKINNSCITQQYLFHNLDKMKTGSPLVFLRFLEDFHHLLPTNWAAMRSRGAIGFVSSSVTWEAYLSGTFFLHAIYLARQSSIQNPLTISLPQSRQESFTWLFHHFYHTKPQKINYKFCFPNFVFSLILTSSTAKKNCSTTYKACSAQLYLNPLVTCARGVHSLNSRPRQLYLNPLVTCARGDDSSSCNLHTQTRTPSHQNPRTNPAPANPYPLIPTDPTGSRAGNPLSPTGKPLSPTGSRTSKPLPTDPQRLSLNPAPTNP
ncbi:hypothetical protein VP01_1664g5 [Puccinia sorghi]|uniref:Uncharacterized protein n=1 Tax=Puccinia sorghi TaxID=27349 RepID=A0A0L6VG66_9BASI|nr:hypothetical protein VP01_1664g5 [Puccinia sorghi]